MQATLEKILEQVIAAVVPQAVQTFLDSEEAETCTNNYSKFSAKWNMMRAARDDLKDICTNYESQMKRTMDDWFKRVEDVENQSQELENGYSALQDIPPWRRVISRNIEKKLSKEMDDMCSVMADLITECTELRGSLVHKVVKPVLKMAAPDISLFSCQQHVLDQILKFLPNQSYATIRLVGMSGTGKTAILMNLNNHEMVGCMFEKVIWVTVSSEDKHTQNLSTEMLQHVILERLRIDDIQGTTDIIKASRRIYQELTGVKFLLLLDDVKEDLDLDIIGIPKGAQGSKIVMTTKFLHVQFPLCYTIQVERLSLVDSLAMFLNLMNYTDDIRKMPELERVAHKTLQICDGLPLMVKMAAMAFKSVDKHEHRSWSDASELFKQWPEKKHNNLMEKLIKFCSEQLEDQQKRCFLYSALHPEDSDISIDGLLDCWAAENLLNTGHDAKQAGRTVLGQLKNVILLEEDATGDFVRMHKVIRAIALRLLSEEMKDACFVRTTEAVRKPALSKRPRLDDLWKDKKWISLANNSTDVLSPEAPESSKLTTLFLQNYSKNINFADSFFDNMRRILVLNLYKTELTKLPTSLCRLSYLRVLNLNGCRVLNELPDLIGKLESLEVLDIRDTGVSKLPETIEHLGKMRRLLVSFSMSTEDQYDPIFRLSLLEELIVDVDSVMQDWCNDLIDGLIQKVSTMGCLVSFECRFQDKVIDVIQVVGDTLRMYIPKEEQMGSFVKRIEDFEWRCFEVYMGCLISDEIQFPEFYRYDRFLKYCGETGHNSEAIHDVVRRVQAFELINHNDIEHVSMSVVESMEDVRGCLIQSCNEMRSVLGDDWRSGSGYGSSSSSSSRSLLLLPNLERLYLKMLPELDKIAKGLVPLGSLSKLKSLVLFRCPMMSVVITVNIVEQLQELEYLEIEDCSRVKEIVEGGITSPHVPQVILKLTTLVICKLPSLRNILSMPSLEKLKIHECSNLRRLPYNSVTNAMKLKKLEVQRHWWEALQWRDYDIKHQLLPCCSFI